MTKEWLLLAVLLCSMHMFNGFTFKSTWRGRTSSHWESALRVTNGAAEENLAGEDESRRDSVEGAKKSGDGVGGYDPGEALRQEEVNVGDPQIKVKEKERSVTSILKELAAIQQQGPQKYCILGTRHCSYLHQQIIELL